MGRAAPGLLTPFAALRDNLPAFGIVAIGLPLLAVVALRLLSWTERGERWLRVVPRWGALREAGRMALFCRSLGLLVGAGVPIDEAMAVVAGALPAGAVRRSVREAGLRLASGEPVAEVFRRRPFFSPLVRLALEWPQEAGGVAPGFARIAGFYEEELARLAREMDVAAEVGAILIASVVAGVVVILAWGGYFQILSHMY
jgi:type II secretory pathway component PulF